jgi:hypothetical protein
MGPALDGELRATAAYTRYRDHFRFRPTDDALLDALLSGVTMDQLSSLPGASRRRGAQLVYVLWACQMLRVGAAALQTPATRQQPMPGNMRQTPRATPHVTPPVDPATPRRASRPSTHEIPSSGASETQRATTTETRPTGTGQTKRPATTEVERGSRETPRTERSTRDLTSTVDEPTFVQELVEFEEKIEAGAHAFDLLGVSLGAGKREVRRRWADLSRRLHPDALEAKGWGHLRDRVGNVFAALSEAQMLLSDKDQRQRLAEQLERGEDPASTDATATVRAAFEAEIIGKDADRFLKASKFDRALAKYDEAMTINSGEPDFRAAAAWCRYQLSPKARPDGQTAERALADVIKEAPALARAYYFRGMVLKDLRAYEPAAAAFHEALRLDSRMIDAERQLRALKAAVKRR